MLKREQKQMAHTITALERVRNFILSDRIALCTKGTQATTTLHAVRPDGITFYELEKQIGSEFCLIFDAIRNLKNMLKKDGANEDE